MRTFAGGFGRQFGKIQAPKRTAGKAIRNTVSMCTVNLVSALDGPAFNARGRRTLQVNPKAGERVVVDISALITLHRLELLDAALDYFGKVLIPAEYLASVLEDSRQMVLSQRSRHESARKLTRLVSDGAIRLEAIEVMSCAVVDEHGDAEALYRLTDMVEPVRLAGLLSEADLKSIAILCKKPSGVDDEHPPLTRFQEIVVGLSTLESIARYGLLDTFVEYYRVRMTVQDQDELKQRLTSIAWQEETRKWHWDLWERLRDDPRVTFVPHSIPEDFREKDVDSKDYLAFLASFVAQELKIPLLADDRVCQTFNLNELTIANAGFGSDSLIASLWSSERISLERIGPDVGRVFGGRSEERNGADRGD